MSRFSLLSSALLVVGGRAQSHEMQQVLAQHNMYRCMHGLPDLVWDHSLATNAQTWADKSDYAHSPSDQRVVDGQQCGENLAWGFPHLSGTTASKDWYEEIQYTSPYGTATSMSDSHPEGKAIGHYTQVAWAATTMLGCGKGTATVSSNSGDFWVCQYCKAGNYAGQFAQNVPAPIKGPQQCGGSASDVPGNFPASLLNAPVSSVEAPAPTPPAPGHGSHPTPTHVSPAPTHGSPAPAHGSSGTVAPPSNTGSSGTVAPPSNAGGVALPSNTDGLGVGMGMGMGMGMGTDTSDTSNFGLGAASEVALFIVSGSFTVAWHGSSGEDFCKSEPALNAVELGIAKRVGLSAEQVRAWCRDAHQRRLAADAPSPRRLQAQSGDVVLEYSINIPDGADANAVKAAMDSDPDALAAAIRAELAKSTSFEIALSNVVARIAGALDSSESMPQEGGAVGSANQAAAVGSFSGLFELSGVISKVPHASPLGIGAASLLAASVAVVRGLHRRRAGVVIAEVPQNPVE